MLFCVNKFCANKMPSTLKNSFLKNAALILIAVLTSGLLAACQPDAPKVSEQPTAAVNVQADANSAADLSVVDLPPMSAIAPDGKIHIDWTQLDTKVAPIDPAEYAYPFAENSDPVVKYAAAFKLSPKQAQHAMLLSMASPEALGKVLDQITGEYLGSEFADGAAPILKIYTTPKVAASRFDYVFADTFGKGLVLPIEIVPKAGNANKKDGGGGAKMKGVK